MYGFWFKLFGIVWKNRGGVIDLCMMEIVEGFLLVL